MKCKPFPEEPLTVLSYPETQREISRLIQSSKPFFVGRFGSTELRALLRWRASRNKPPILRELSLILAAEPPLPFEDLFRNLVMDSGFYPLTEHAIEHFYRLMVDSMPEIDILASWLPREKEFASQLSRSKRTRLENLEPFWAAEPWTSQLEGRRVAVIHPFSHTISKQFSNHRADIFPGKRTLPEFDLVTLRAVQSLGRPDPRFDSWAQALNWMTDEALALEFDVALIGCGAYGFPLAANLKKAGRRSIHLGGLTQLMFGIRGNRWDQNPKYQKLINHRWTRPSAHEVPENSSSLGRNSYW